MKLDAVDRELSMLQSHNFAIVCLSGNFERIRQRFAFYDQRMIASGFQWLGQIFENALLLMMDLRSFAVH